MIEKSVSYKKKVYDNLKEGIIRGHYKQGEALNERKLSDELGVSRTPIREALQMLDADGWVVIEPYKETTVRSFDIDYVIDAQKVRRALEILAVEDAIRNMDAEDKKKLSECFDKQAATLDEYDPVEFIRYDREFHEVIYAASKNKMLQQLLNTLNDMIRYFGIKVVLHKERSLHTLKEHKKILDAILIGNEAAAKDAINHHLSKTEEAIIQNTTDKD